MKRFRLRTAKQIMTQKLFSFRHFVEGPYTLFAPTNAAFAKLGDALIQKLLANTDVLSGKCVIHPTDLWTFLLSITITRPFNVYPLVSHFY